MNVFRNASFRLGLALLVPAGLCSNALAQRACFRAVINCNHEDTLEMRMDDTGGIDGPAPFLVLEVSGAGTASLMQGSVVLVSRDYSFNAITNVGHAIFKFRDCTGDVLVTTSDLVSTMTPGGVHAATFEGTWSVDGQASTGRFAGATGDGYIVGWADNDGPEPNFEIRTSGQGWADYRGHIELKRNGHCHGHR